MRKTVTLDDALYAKALEVADPRMDKADLFREPWRPSFASGLPSASPRWVHLHLKCEAFLADALDAQHALLMGPVLVDTSVWVSHFRHRNIALIALLHADLVLTHPMIVAELACGTPPEPRLRTLGDLDLLESVQQATLTEVKDLIERERQTELQRPPIRCVQLVSPSELIAFDPIP